MNIEKIREDFPILKRRFGGKPIVYLDNACTTLKPIQVINAIVEYYEKLGACAGRSVHKLGKETTEKYEKCRETIARFLKAKPEEVVYTKNATEGLNLVMHSLGLKKGDVILTTDKEHNSALLPIQILSERTGIKHEIVFSKEDNTFNLEKFEEMMNSKVKLVSMIHTSNLDGYTIPAEKIIRIAHDFNALVMLDGAQSVPHKKIDVKKLDADFLAFSGHKMLGPTGIGVVYGKYNLLEKLNPFLVGGDTVTNTTYTTHNLMKPPEKFEAGIQNYAGTIGLAAAVDYIEEIGRENIERYETELNKTISEELSSMDGIKILGPKDPELRGGIISFTIQGIGYHDAAIMLDELANVMVRSGQHCVHSWFNAHKIEGSVRASLYLYNTKEEAKVFVETLKQITKLR